MKKYLFVFVVCLLGISPVLAGDYTGTVEQIYSTEETGVFYVILSSTAGVPLVLKETNDAWGVPVGASNVERMHLQLLTALASGKNVWIGTNGSTLDVWGTTLYR